MSRIAIRHTTCVLLAALTTAIALPAAAQNTTVEAVGTARQDNINCRTGSEFNFMPWHRGDGAIRIVGEGEDDLEFWGHLIDLSGEASLTGISGATASLVKGRGGAENGLANCPRVGSAIVHINIQTPATSPQTGTLTIGNERLPVTLLPRQAMDVRWSDNNISRRSASSGSSGPATLTPEQIQDIQSRYNDCVTDRTNRQANPSGDTTIILPGALTCEQRRDIALGLIPDLRGSGGSGSSPQSRTLVRCADDQGLTTTLYPDGSTLIVNLPDNRTGLMTCLRSSENFLHPFIWHSAENPDFHFFRVSQPDNLRMTASGTYPNLNFSRFDAATVAGRYYKITFNSTELQTLVGSYERTLRFTPSDGSTLTLIVQSQVPYGVKSVSAPIFAQNVGRLSSTLNLRVETQQPVKTGQVFEWTVNSADGASAASCFEAVTGSITPPAGPATFSLPITVKETAACMNRDYRVRVSVAGKAGNSLYGRDATFTLPSLSQVRGTGTLTDDRIKIQGQTPIIRP